MGADFTRKSAKVTLYGSQTSKFKTAMQKRQHSFVEWTERGSCNHQNKNKLHSQKILKYFASYYSKHQNVKLSFFLTQKNIQTRFECCVRSFVGKERKKGRINEWRQRKGENQRFCSMQRKQKCKFYF